MIREEFESLLNPWRYIELEKYKNILIHLIGNIINAASIILKKKCYSNHSLCLTALPAAAEAQGFNWYIPVTVFPEHSKYL